ncbi:hypothetical protein [Streptomyces sp. WAC 01325]|uniref:hypothetical protein n=1 Tax=Streptomyces sp. WAC 01325 TaxID=2203202 RepID=UPI00163C93CA|nr:hypothetical protein [Streptomyces sp. WAC 01325]
MGSGREVDFLELATELITASPLPLMLTGGITRRQTAEDVLAGGVALIGMDTALATNPEVPHQWREGREANTQPRRVTWSDKTLA